ncbi:MAG: hypothetical protein UIC45_00515 [Paludibacteraceae bacterium]|nr:hypothetical protein [Paludibacteraceae bacterium]
MKTMMNKILSVLAVFFFCLTTFTAGAANIIPAGTELYLKPNSNWKADGARFAAYFFTDNVGSEWVSMTDCDGDGIYEVNSPNKEYAKVIFCRMNPANTTNNWDKNSNFWNQTANLTYDGTNNTYTVEDGTWDNGNGTWSSHTQDYYIAGNGTAGNPWCNGNDWGANFADNKLQGTGDVRTITFKNVPPGVYKYKITRGSWNCDSWGYNGGDLTLELAQWSDVTVSFNVSTKYIETEANEVKDLMTVYLDPKVEGGGDWMVNNEARIAVYLFNSTDNTKYGWVSAKKDDNGLYYAQFPDAYNTYIWCRMKGDNGDNNWENRWNQTDNITYVADKTLTKLTSFGDGYAKSYQMINCTFPPIEEEFPVMVRINQFVESDPCNYLFQSFEEAWIVLKQIKTFAQ